MRGLASRRSIRTSVFAANAAIITLTVIALVSYISIWGGKRLRADMDARLDDMARAASASIDEGLRKMDSVSVSVLYSKMVKDRFVAYSGAGAAARDEQLIDVLLAIIGPTLPVRQVNIYDFKGRGFGTGMDNRARSVDPAATPWFGEALKAEGSMVLSAPHGDRSLNRYLTTQGAGDLYISLARLFFDRYSKPIGVVEVEQSCEELFRDLKPEEGRAAGSPVAYVYGGGGELFFPAARPASAGRRLASSLRSEFSGWTVELSADEGTLLEPLRRFVAASVVLALGLLAGSLLTSFAVARRITRPISRLRDQIVALELGSLAPESARPQRGGPNELEELDAAFHGMRGKLKRSIDSRIEAEGAEAHARLLALQSQMNPHFLYNTIATIGALAEEGLGDRAAALCSHLSDMLRYVSSQEGTETPAAAELEFTERYLACVGVRYGQRLSYRLDYDPLFAALSLPRLLVQPLVENAVKYATVGEPPWEIRVRASVQGDRWEVAVEDDGPGFSSEAAARLDALLRASRDEGAPYRGLELHGMGLANIAARLRLRYGEGAAFEYGNLGPRGAFVRIGAPATAGATGGDGADA